MKFYLIIFIITIIIKSCFILVTKSNPHEPLVPALYVFGDSLVDNGNNNMLLTIAKANYAPYSLDFPAPVDLGRFTNGRTLVDFIADYLHLPYPPAYASRNVMGMSNPFPNNSFGSYNYTFGGYSYNFGGSNYAFGGYNYASAACGILPETGADLGQCHSFDKQLDMFNKTVESQLSQMYKDPRQLKEHLSKSIFLVGVGGNDYLNNYFLPMSRRKFYSHSQFTQLLIDTLSLQLKRLYDLGARKIGVADVGPVGCIPNGPAVVTLNKTNGQCDEGANNILQLFNDQLPFLIQNLTHILKGSHLTFAPTYSLSHSIISNPSEYGFINSIKPCCETLDGRFTCIPNGTVCSNPNKYFFWDGYHPTEAVHSLFAKECINGSYAQSPYNIAELVKL